MDEIEKAKIAHDSVREDLKDSKVLLSNTREKIYNSINIESSPKEKVRINDLNFEFSLISDKQKKQLENLFYQWSLGGDHALLMEILDLNMIPDNWHQKRHIPNPPTLEYALKLAKDRGYQIPEEYINKDKYYYSETEAYHVAEMITRGDCNFLSSDLLKSLINFSKQSFHQLTGQFNIPNPTNSEKTPYFVDQLWIVSEDSGYQKQNELENVRLICLEIDGPQHLTPKSLEKQAFRDSKLNEMGYEVYHIASWWCRIDPFRAICTFLSSADLVPLIENDFSFSIPSISDYVCNHCGKPMIRWDVDWIQILDDGTGIPRFYHRSCSNQITQY